jgi:hypothetical protein
LNMEQSVPKHQHTKFRYWEINQKKEYNILWRNYKERVTQDMVMKKNELNMKDHKVMCI